MNGRTTRQGKRLILLQALFLMLVLAASAQAGTDCGATSTHIVTRYGIDEQGRAFAYPVTETAPAAPQQRAVTVTGPQQGTKRYGVDEHGRSFVYEVTTARPSAAGPPPTPASTCAVSSSPLRPAPTVTRKPTAKADPAPAGRERLPAPAMAAVQKTVTKTSIPVSLPPRPVASHRPVGDTAGSALTGVPEEGSVVHRVIFARYRQLSRASGALRRLQTAGYRAYVIRGHDRRYTVCCGAYFRQGKAAALRDELAGKGIRVVIRKENLSFTGKVAHAGEGPSREAARKVSMTLRERGIATRGMRNGSNYILIPEGGQSRG